MEGIAPATGTALLLLVAFVLPGFVTLVLRENTYVVREATTPFERLLLSLSYSVRIWGILLLFAYFVVHWRAHDVSRLYHGKRGLGAYILLGALALFVLPALLSECGRWWRRSTRVRSRVLGFMKISVAHNTPSGWDHFFGSNTPALVRLTLDDGRVIGGFFGTDSLSGYTEHGGDLFLQERWELDVDAWFLRPAPNSLGLWVPHDRIVSMEVYDPPRPP